MKTRITLYLLFLITLASNAQESNLNVQVNLDTIYLGNSFTLQIEATNASINDLNLDLNHCDIQSHFNSSSTTILNGKVFSSVAKHYIVTPQQTGPLTIESLKAKTDEGDVYSKKIELVVMPNPENIVQDNSIHSFSKDPFFSTPNAKPKEKEGLNSTKSNKRKRRKF